MTVPIKSTPIDSKLSAVYSGGMNNGGYFTIDEVISATGFDRRTVAYYVQEGLLPKVGRRGRLTRYPQHVVDRLLFIKLLRKAEESGERPVPMTLAEIRIALERIPVRELHAIGQGTLPVSAIDRFTDRPGDTMDETAPPPPADHWVAACEDPPDLASRERRMNLMLEETGVSDLFIPRVKSESRLRESRFMAAEESAAYGNDDEPEVHACMAPPSYREDHRVDPDLSDQDLDTLLTHLCRLTAHQSHRRGSSENWNRIAITPGLELAARDVDRQGRSLLDRIAKLLRRKLADSLDRS